MALSLAAESESIDSENWLFEYKLQEYKEKTPNLRSCLEFIPAFYKECFRGFLFVLMRSIAGYVTNKNGEKDRKQI